jgi:hypothetical protein
MKRNILLNSDQFKKENGAEKGERSLWAENCV